MRGHLRRRGDAWELRAYAGETPSPIARCTGQGRFEVASERQRRLWPIFVQEVAGGGHAASDATVGALVGQWFELAMADLSPSTIRGYERSIRRYIQPALGGVPLHRLQVAQLDRLYVQLRQRGGRDGGPPATATVRQVHAVLRRALQQGVKWGWTDSNPAVLATPPSVRNRQIVAPDLAAVVRLIEEARSETDLAALLQLAATTGARRGELCGLHRDVVDFSRGTVTIARSVVDGARGADREGRCCTVTLANERTVAWCPNVPHLDPGEGEPDDHAEQAWAPHMSRSDARPVAHDSLVGRTRALS